MRRIAYLILSILAITSCSKSKKTYEELGSSGLTTRTENLRRNLMAYEDRGVMLGQMYATAEGIGWQGDSCRSDLNEVTGDNPAVVGYELAGIESGQEKCRRHRHRIDTPNCHRFYAPSGSCHNALDCTQSW